MVDRLDRFVSSLRWLLPACLVLAACLAFGQANTPPKASLVLTGSAKAKPGSLISGTVTVTFAPGLHAYQNPPTESYMIPVTIKAGGGAVVLKSVKYPKGTDEIVGGSTTPVKTYSNAIHIGVMVVAPKKPGSYPVSLTVGYQQCNANNCFAPSTVPVSAKLVVAAAAVPAPKKPATSPMVQKGVPETQKTGVPVGKDVVKQYPKTLKNQKKKPQPKQQEKPGKALASVPDTKQPPTPPKKSPPIVAAQKPTPVAAAAPHIKSSPTVTSSLTPTATVAQASPPANDSSGDGFIASNLRNAFKSGNYFFVIGLALLTGLALAVTPCVYPMIPITVGFFSNQSAGNRAARVGLGLMYMLGLAITYGVVGGVSAALGGTIGSLFQAPWFLFALGLLMAALALSMFDVYEIRLPAFLGKQIRGRSGAVGALVMGLLMGFAAAPCAGPIVTAFAVKVAEYRNLPLGMLLFTSIGVGLGLPFFAIGALSSGAKTLPRSGGWLKTLKALLGIVVLWVALSYFLQAFALKSDDPRSMMIQAIFLVLSGLYLFLIEKSGNTQVIWGIKGAAILLWGLFAGQILANRTAAIRDQQLAALGSSSVIRWVKWTPEAFEDAKKSGKPIVIDASADWCALCHEIENAVFKKPEGIAAMQNVVAMTIDQSTGVDPKYVELTNKTFGIKGLPHVEFFKPGGQSVKVVTGFDQLDSPDKLKQYLALARS